jgi:hypothetical protein
VFGKFEYDLKLTPVRPGYEYMAKRIKEDPLGPNFIWAADIQNDSKKPLYVDAVHYSSELNQMLARFILENVRDRRLVAELNSSKYVKESTQGSHPQ